MKNYSKFLLEHKLWKGTSEISEEKMLELLKTKYSDYFSNKYSFYNDFRISRYIYNVDNKILQINPKEYERKSLNTENYYTLIINNEWKEFPKRKLICRIEQAPKIDIYEYIVIPSNNSNWGICPDYDLWFSFKDSLKIIGENIIIKIFNEHLNTIYMSIFNKKLSDDNYVEFKKDLNSLTKKIRMGKFNFNIIKTNYSNKLDIENIVKNIKIYGAYELYKMILNKKVFKHVTNRELKYNILMNKQQEVWTDDECLLINSEYYFENLNNIKNKLKI